MDIMKNITTEEFFILTNPLFWIWMLIYITYRMIKYSLLWSGIEDWYFILFTNKIENWEKETLKLSLNYPNDINHSWLRKKAWKYSIKKVKQLLNLYNVGDTIEWSFENDHKSIFKGKTYRSEIASIDIENECYCVYAEYGQDKISFKNAKLITKKNNT